MQQRTKRNAVFAHRIPVAHPVIRLPIVLVVAGPEKRLHRREKVGRFLVQSPADDGCEIVEGVGHSDIIGPVAASPERHIRKRHLTRTTESTSGLRASFETKGPR